MCLYLTLTEVNSFCILLYLCRSTIGGCVYCLCDRQTKTPAPRRLPASPGDLSFLCWCYISSQLPNRHVGCLLAGSDSSKICCQSFMGLNCSSTRGVSVRFINMSTCCCHRDLRGHQLFIPLINFWGLNSVLFQILSDLQIFRIYVYFQSTLYME